MKMMVVRHVLFFVLSVCLVKGTDFDSSELVVDVDFDTKKNKEITGFSQEEKDNLVNIHNAYRSLVRPYPADMIEVTWDDEIAAFAQDWADQCTATHRSNRDLDPWINMGENLFWWYSGRYHEGQAVKYWWDEVQYYTLSTPECEPGEVCGHYITMAWAKTEKIGCGVARCDRLLDHPDYGRGAYYFVCNYSGRFVSGAKPYKATDIPCSACHNTAYPKCRHNLCVTNDMLLSGEGYDGNTAMVGLYRSLNYTDEPTTTTTPEPTTTTPEPTTTITEPATTQSTRHELSTSFDKVDDHCRARTKDYVRIVCWRLNNMLKDILGIPKAADIDERWVEENGHEAVSYEHLETAFQDVDQYCETLDSAYKQRVCRKLSSKMKELLDFE